MKKFLILFFATVFTLFVFADDRECEFLARVAANEVGEAPYIVKLAFCEMLVNRKESELFPDTLVAVAHSLGCRKSKKTPDISCMYAAATALGNYGFFKDVFYMKKWRDVKNTPPKNGGVKLYDWYFYSSAGSM